MLLYFTLFGCRDEPIPDGTWQVTITPEDIDGDGFSTNNCTEDEDAGIVEKHDYSLFYTGSKMEIKMGEELFATGEWRGCYHEYNSSIYLEESPQGDFRWTIAGRADAQGAAGGCDTLLPDELDWSGYEILTVVSSENESVTEECYYEMKVEGVFVTSVD